MFYPIYSYNHLELIATIPYYTNTNKIDSRYIVLSVYIDSIIAKYNNKNKWCYKSYHIYSKIDLKVDWTV